MSAPAGESSCGSEPTRQSPGSSSKGALAGADVDFLGYPDGRLYVTHDLRRDVSRVVRQRRPQRVVTQSPERNWERIYASHPDHLAAGEAAMCAVYPDARNPFAHPELIDEGLEPWTVDEVWIMASGDPAATTYVDTTDSFPRKLAALRAHASQVSHMDDLEERIRGWGALTAARAGMPEGRVAEGFRVVDTR